MRKMLMAALGFSVVGLASHAAEAATCTETQKTEAVAKCTFRLVFSAVEQGTIRNIWDTNRPSGNIRFADYSNREACLPATKTKADGGAESITYREFYLKQGAPGARRLVRGSDGRRYFTTNHYAPGSWCQITTKP